MVSEERRLDPPRLEVFCTPGGVTIIGPITDSHYTQSDETLFPAAITRPFPLSSPHIIIIAVRFLQATHTAYNHEVSDIY